MPTFWNIRPPELIKTWDPCFRCSWCELAQKWSTLLIGMLFGWKSLLKCHSWFLHNFRFSSWINTTVLGFDSVFGLSISVLPIVSPARRGLLRSTRAPWVPFAQTEFYGSLFFILKVRMPSCFRTKWDGLNLNKKVIGKLGTFFVIESTHGSFRLLAVSVRRYLTWGFLGAAGFKTSRTVS